MSQIKNDFTINFLNSLQAFIYVSDIETCEILFMNDSMKKEFGLTEEAVGKICFNVFKGSKGKNCDFCYTEKGCGDSFTPCTWDEFNTYANKYYRNTDSFMEWVDGKTAHIRESYDVTAEYKNKSDLDEVKKIAQNYDRAKEDFFERMSKNFNLPINTIIGLTKIASSSYDLSKIQNCLKKISDEAKKLSQITTNVFDMAKIETNGFALIKEPFSIENLLISIANNISPKCSEKSQVFQIKMDMGMPAYFIGDEMRIAQVLNNFLSNAVKFTPDGGKIQLEVNQISLLNNTSTIEFLVSDTGYGISKNLLLNIASLFEEGDPAQIGKYKGLGLGLPISKSIVGKMGGELRVYSNEVIGSTFCFSIKLEVFESRFFERKLSPGINIKNLNVLLIDNSIENCEYFRKIMRGFKVECDTTTTYLGVVDKLEESNENNKPYNIVFIEKDANDMDSLSIAKLINVKFQNTAVVILKTKDSDVENFLDSGFVKFITKPIFPSSLLDMINEIISIPNKGQSLYVARNYNFSHKHILLVEDVDINQEIIAKALKDTKVGMSYAENGLIALEMFKQEPEKYDLILMDIHMPEMDGYETARAIRAIDNPKSRDIPIIALTANVFQEDIEKCLESGMDSHIPKPVELDVLFEKLLEFMPITRPHDNDMKISDFIDVEEALKRVRGNEKVYKALLGNFMKNNKFDMLKNELFKNDFEKAFKIAHSIKGAAANLSLIAIYQIVNIIEHEILDGRNTANSVKEAEEVFDNTMRCIEAYLLS
ncbi:MAG: response regulator [Clostridiales bacterium]|jgi:CheY-like chemotaxis protein|nr:response regulator [Clostridiales bacterium]